MAEFAPIPEEEEILTLKEALQRFFPSAFAKRQITTLTLRAEAARGNLVVMRIGRTDWVTPSAMREMMNKCRVPQKAPASTSTQKSGSGSSATDRSRDALAAANSIATELKKGLRPTSPKSSSPQPGKVISLASRSQRS